MSAGLTERKSVAIEAVRQAAALCARVQDSLGGGTMAKGDLSPVTVADFGSQALVCSRLAGSFPDDPIVGEEDSAELRDPANSAVLTAVTDALSSFHPGIEPAKAFEWIDLGGASPSSSGFWTLDPIDGTKGYLRREQYAVALAWIVDGLVQLGVLACPGLSIDGSAPGVIAWAIRGQGAGWMSLHGHAEGTLTVSALVEPATARVCESVESGHSAHDRSAKIAEILKLQGDPVRMDSQAKYAALASGMAEVYLRLPTRADYREKIWDHAAGALIVEEAGGRVTDIDGKALDFRLGRELQANRGVVATNARLHPMVLEAITRTA